MIEDYLVDTVSNDCFIKWLFNFNGVRVHVIKRHVQPYSLAIFKGKEYTIKRNLDKEAVERELKKYEEKFITKSEI